MQERLNDQLRAYEQAVYGTSARYVTWSTTNNTDGGT